MKYTANEFIEMIKQQDPDEWINYLEIFILDTGIIELVSKASQLEDMNIIKKEYKTCFPRILFPLDFICEKYRIVVVWNDSILIGKNINRFQMITIDKLQKARLISMNLKVHRSITKFTYFEANKPSFRKYLVENYKYEIYN